ncbi:MAG: type II toxin-antitoxin system HicA family toxin [Gallionellaceae bacterium]|nr:type II toxin-antitoxin system HicA family toxin [Gallionellaceae bacterium]
MKTKHRKTLEAIFSKPTKANIVFSDIEALFVALGGDIIEGAGSRITVELSDERAHFHRPHPGKEAKKYQVENAREFLERQEMKP